MTPEVICKEVIITTLSLRGKGEKLSPFRRIKQVFDKDGQLIAEHDPSPETYTMWDLIHFSRWVQEKKYQTIDPFVVERWLDEVVSDKADH